MADIAAVTQRVLATSTVYKQTAGALLARAVALQTSGNLSETDFQRVRDQHDQLVVKANDMLATLDDTLAAALDAPLAQVEQATSTLKDAQAAIAKVAQIVDCAIKCVAAAAAVAAFIAAPGTAAAAAAATAIGGAVSTIVNP